MTDTEMLKLLSILYGIVILIMCAVVAHHYRKFMRRACKPSTSAEARREYEQLLKQIETADIYNIHLMPSKIRIFSHKWALLVNVKTIIFWQGELHATLLNRSHSFRAFWGIDYSKPLKTAEL